MPFKRAHRALFLATMAGIFGGLFLATQNMTYLRTLTAVVEFERTRERSRSGSPAGMVEASGSRTDTNRTGLRHNTRERSYCVLGVRLLLW